MPPTISPAFVDAGSGSDFSVDECPCVGESSIANCLANVVSLSANWPAGSEDVGVRTDSFRRASVERELEECNSSIVLESVVVGSAPLLSGYRSLSASETLNEEKDSSSSVGLVAVPVKVSQVVSSIHSVPVKIQPEVSVKVSRASESSEESSSEEVIPISVVIEPSPVAVVLIQVRSLPVSKGSELSDSSEVGCSLADLSLSESEIGSSGGVVSPVVPDIGSSMGVVPPKAASIPCQVYPVLPSVVLESAPLSVDRVSKASVVPSESVVSSSESMVSSDVLSVVSEGSLIGSPVGLVLPPVVRSSSLEGS